MDMEALHIKQDMNYLDNRGYSKKLAFCDVNESK